MHRRERCPTPVAAAVRSRRRDRKQPKSRIGTFTKNNTGFAERNTTRPFFFDSPFQTGMASIPSPASGWRKMQIPRPLQQLFDHFPLQTYEPNHLPERSQHLTSSNLPTLYVFSTDSDARLGLPSFNPACLKWQVCPHPSPSSAIVSPYANTHMCPL